MVLEMTSFGQKIADGRLLVVTVYVNTDKSDITRFSYGTIYNK